MNESTETALAEQLATGITAIDGVLRLFPERTATAAFLALVGTGDVRPIRVDTTGSCVIIGARLGTERSIPTRTVIAGVVAAVTEVLGATPYELALEFAYID